MARSSSRQAVPNWFVFIVGLAVVFGGFYIWQGLRSYIESGGQSVVQVTEQARERASATQERQLAIQEAIPTRAPTSTPLPDCENFVVTVDSAIIRRQPSTGGQFLANAAFDTVLCVIRHLPENDWYQVDVDPVTRRVEAGYIYGNLIRPLEPTATPSSTSTAAPTITATFTDTPPATLNTTERTRIAQTEAALEQVTATATATSPTDDDARPPISIDTSTPPAGQPAATSTAAPRGPATATPRVVSF